jgi:hypothetical protein
MPRFEEDRSLRRAVYPLAQALPDDVEFILSALTDQERAKVEHALSGLIRIGDSQTLQPELTGLSDWLASRVRRDRFDTSAQSGVSAGSDGMTLHAAAVLRACAGRLAMSAEYSDKPSAAPPSLIERVIARVWRRRAAA